MVLPVHMAVVSSAPNSRVSKQDVDKLGSAGESSRSDLSLVKPQLPSERFKQLILLSLSKRALRGLGHGLLNTYPGKRFLMAERF